MNLSTVNPVFSFLYLISLSRLRQQGVLYARDFGLTILNRSNLLSQISPGVRIYYFCSRLLEEIQLLLNEGINILDLSGKVFSRNY